MPRRRASLWPSKVKLTSSMPWRSAAAPKAASAPLAAPLKRTQLSGSTGADPSKPGLVFQRSEEHTSELQSRFDLVCRLLLEKKNKSPDSDFKRPSTATDT